MASPEDVPSDINALLVRFRGKKVTAQESMKLGRWIINMKKVPSFKLKPLVEAGYDYTRTDYERLKRMANRLEKKLEISAVDTLKKLEADAFARFIEDTWNEAKSIATDTVMRWRNRAIEYGYFDEEKEKVRMKDFLEDACNFYIDKRDMVETLEARIKDLKAACATFAEFSKPQVLRITALHSYMKFMTQVTRLAAQGIPVPEAIIEEVRTTINRVIRSAALPIKQKKIPKKYVHDIPSE